MNQFKDNDVVKVTDSGACYTTSSAWVRKNIGCDNNYCNVAATKGSDYKVISSGIINGNEVAYYITDGYSCYLIGERGLELLRRGKTWKQEFIDACNVISAVRENRAKGALYLYSDNNISIFGDMKNLSLSEAADILFPNPKEAKKKELSDKMDALLKQAEEIKNQIGEL